MARSASRSGACGCMSMALCFGLVRSFAGQTLTQRLQPVQSSGATWIVKSSPLYSLPLYAVDLKVGGASAERALVVHLRPDRGVRAHERALVALDADLRIPDGDLEREVPLLPFRRPDRPRAVDREGAHGKQVALAGQHHRGHLLHEVRRPLGDHRRTRARGARRLRHGNLVQVGERLVHDLAVPAHDLRTALAVGLLDRLLDVRDRLVAGQDARDAEEAGLHDRVDARAHARALAPGRRRRWRRSGAASR